MITEFLSSLEPGEKNVGIVVTDEEYEAILCDPKSEEKILCGFHGEYSELVIVYNGFVVLRGPHRLIGPLKRIRPGNLVLWKKELLVGPTATNSR